MLELRFPLPDRPLSINEGHARNWAAKRRRLQGWREGVALAWNVAGKKRKAVQGKPCNVHVTIPFDVSEKQFKSGRRDPHNYVGTVVKAIVDQLACDKHCKGQKCNHAWPDDTPEWVTVIEPTLVRGSEVVVTLTPRDDGSATPTPADYIAMLKELGAPADVILAAERARGVASPAAVASAEQGGKDAGRH